MSRFAQNRDQLQSVKPGLSKHEIEKAKSEMKDCELQLQAGHNLWLTELKEREEQLKKKGRRNKAER